MAFTMGLPSEKNAACDFSIVFANAGACLALGNGKVCSAPIYRGHGAPINRGTTNQTVPLPSFGLPRRSELIASQPISRQTGHQ